MTNMNEAAKRAAELANERISANRLKYKPDEFERTDAFENCQAFARFIQHVSDVAERVLTSHVNSTEAEKADEELRALILPKPVDLIAELFREAFADSNIGDFDGYWKVMAKFRELAAKRGLTIAPIGEQP